ncbi:MAG: 4-(cytidine 5'-diphospho)-2-C-methyl-D-erythritol kinase [Phycisphaerales bacterium]|nr:4-(cytidine 5'-diphospho)-2-C-methyl-D-erythritol kinase [Phycisphaerales bacterium]
MNTRITLFPTGQFQIPAPCKLNLALRVFPLRTDGFHPIETWMLPTSWHDTLTFTPSSEEGGAKKLTLQITGRSQGVPTNLDKNLVGKAALKLAARGNILPTGTLQLHKVVPPGGGLGGGSSDAASTILLLNHAWKLQLPEQVLLEIAGELGSDVPFFIPCRAALCTGRGEIMSPLPAEHPLFAVLMIPPQGCPTKDVYQAFDRLPPPNHPSADWQKLAASNADALGKLLINDLAPPAFEVAPWLKTLRDQASAAIGRTGGGVHMTGSGSTLFTLAGSSVEAQAIRERLTPVIGDENALVPVRLYN